MSLYGLDRHKARVLLEMAITAAVGGAVAAVTAAWVDPTKFDIFNSQAWWDLGRVAATGAFTGLLFLFRSLPRDPSTFQRRSDPLVVEKAAEKMVNTGELPPILPKKP